MARAGKLPRAKDGCRKAGPRPTSPEKRSRVVFPAIRLDPLDLIRGLTTPLPAQGEPVSRLPPLGDKGLSLFSPASGPGRFSLPTTHAALRSKFPLPVAHATLRVHTHGWAKRAKDTLSFTIPHTTRPERVESRPTGSTFASTEAGNVEPAMPRLSCVSAAHRALRVGKHPLSRRNFLLMSGFSPKNDWTPGKTRLDIFYWTGAHSSP